MIKLQIVGNLGKDCIVKEVNGKNVINFSLVHNERYKDSQGNQKERSIWVECAYWTDRTAISPYLKKGQMVYAEGTPEADAYLNKENQASATLRMRVQSIQLLGGNKEGNPSSAATSNPGAYQPSGAVRENTNYGAPSAGATTGASSAQPAPTDDDLPF